jgi:hypothetical protein
MAQHEPGALDATQKEHVAAILGVGCSLRTAANYVSCSPETIRREMDRDPEFARKTQRAPRQCEIGYLQNLRLAASNERHWRAAAWALERLNREDFAARPPDAVTYGQIRRLLARMADVVVEEIDNEAKRQTILKRLEALGKEVREHDTQHSAS